MEDLGPVTPASQTAARDAAPLSSWPPSAPGWELEAERQAPRRRRRTLLPILGLAMAAVGALAGAIVAEVQLPPQLVALKPIFVSDGVTLADVVVEAEPRSGAQPLTPEQRQDGFNECYLPDPLGLGPYAPYRKTRGPVFARVAVPQEGGHTADMGFDVVLHFHGGDPVRKQLVQLAGGVVFVAVDLGLFSAPYTQAFQSKDTFPALLAEITRNLREATGDERAHIRRLALSGWSAGYGAVAQILEVNGDDGIDAVVLLDGMHAGQNYKRPRHDGSLDALSPDTLRALFDFAARATRGEKLFVLTHSNIVPPGYASVKRSADLLLREVHLEREPRERQVGLLEQLTTVDHEGFHIWGYAGVDAKAHCSHTTMLGPIVRDVLEPAWETPPMNRDVPPTPAPALGAAR